MLVLLKRGGIYMKRKDIPMDIVRQRVRILSKDIKIHRGDTRRYYVEKKSIPKLHKEEQKNG